MYIDYRLSVQRNELMRRGNIMILIYYIFTTNTEYYLIV